MKSATKSWLERHRSANPFEIKKAPKDFADIKAGEMMLLPNSQIVAALLHTIPRGQSMEMKQFRAKLSQTHGAEIACPVVTGINLRIVAEAAWEEHQMGKPLAELPPFWRVLNAKSPSTKKLAAGPDFVVQQRRAEGLPD